MTACCVLGNGPGLDAALVPDGALPFGVNRSYLRVWSPVICSMDAPAAREAYRDSGAQAFYVSDGALPMVMPKVAWFDRPSWVENSGALAIWLAAEMRFSPIYLLGFGGAGHAYLADGDSRAYMAKSLIAAVLYARKTSDVIPLAKVDYCPEIG